MEPQPLTMVAFTRAMYNMSYLLYIKYELLALLQNMNNACILLYNIKIALGPATMSSAVPYLHQRRRKKGLKYYDCTALFAAITFLFICLCPVVRFVTSISYLRFQGTIYNKIMISPLLERTGIKDNYRCIVY